MADQIGIKEINEVFDGLEVLADFAGNVLADGKVGISDLGAVVQLAKEFSVLKDAIQDADKAVVEAGDLSQAEVAQILGRVYGLVAKFSGAKRGN